MGKKRPKRQPKKLSVDVVEARQIVLVDEFGTERASLFCLGGDGGIGGYTTIQLNGDDGRPRLELQVDAKGSCIRLLNPNDSSGVSLAVQFGECNGIFIGDGGGRTCITLGIHDPKSNHPPGPHPDIHIIDERTGRFWSAMDGLHERHVGEKNPFNGEDSP